MRRFVISACGVIAAIILFCWIEPAGALVVKDIETCVRVCIIQFNRHGDIYAAMECIGGCSRYGPRHQMAYRSRGELVRSECRKAASAMSPQDSGYRRELKRWCKTRLH